jgi:hypothetical protein
VRLASFEPRPGLWRIGAATSDGFVIDPNTACALWLRDVKGESAFYQVADALVPPEMRRLFEGGDAQPGTRRGSAGTRGCAGS